MCYIFPKLVQTAVHIQHQHIRNYVCINEELINEEV